DAAIEATPKAFYKSLAAEMTRCVEGLEQLHDLCKQKFGASAPGFFKMRTALEEIQGAVATLLQRKLEKEPDPVEVQSAEPPVAKKDEDGDKPGADQATLPLFDGDVTGLQPKSHAEAVARIIAAANYLRKTEPSSPVPYLLLRALRWGE